MDETMSDEDVEKTQETANHVNHIENAKRLKTDNCNFNENSTDSACTSKDTTSQNNTEEDTNANAAEEQETPSNNTSPIISGFPRRFNSSTRNYRRIIVDDESTRSSENGSGDELRSLPSIHQFNSQRTDSERDGASNISDLDSLSTVIEDTDSDESDGEEPAVLKKEKPKHNWFIIPEIINRQMGSTIRKQNPVLFQQRSYGSLHCVQRLKLMKKLEQHEGCVNSLNFHPNGDLLASGSDDLKCVIWDWKRGVPLLSFDTKHRGNVFQSKFLPLSGDLHLVTSARDGQVRLAQVSTQDGLRSSRKLGSHRGPCHKLAILPDQPHIVLSCGEDGLVLSHDVRNSKPERVVSVKSDVREVALYSVNSHPLKSHEFCVGGRDHIVRTYDQRKCSENCPPLNTYYAKKVEKSDSYLSVHVTCAIYNYNGSEILASYNDDDIYIFDTNGEPGTFAHQYQGHRNGATIKGVNYFGPKSEFILSGSDCGNVFFWEKNTEAIVNFMLADDNGVVNVLEPHPSLPFLCTSGLDWDVKLWVPSRDDDPPMTGIADAIKSNSKARASWSSSTDINESQMLWMLWRHLRNSNRQRAAASGAEDFIQFVNNSSNSVNNSSSSSPSSSRSGSGDSSIDSDPDSPPGCTTS
ncbi:DDB1- and CUL4-associated factor 8 isoform X2 [Agrilus planipennis]|uniref:DDB1- and CUL4-associated factor 8 isoform X1 n=1 Tax=Agrilus planipennis TaxID=224129 RepID=A0A1W4XUQ1_AGRPL|nr:DDB1- and CUL4-associated factor 8 isoform X1 [Agrilus planipennis]XP_018336203.1 DDB1- and CUL4-associated factor 8 isoform X1 [Agrilus planipennis]XP_025830870.1 DDB1- and CUL4-associated factor 8 isoform X2 [Agrilus planipennis]